MALPCLSSFPGAPVASLNPISMRKSNASGWSSSSSTSPLGLHTSFLHSSPCSFSFSFAGLSLRHCLNLSQIVVERSNLMKVRAGKAALGLTKRSRSRKSRARTHGFRIRMRTPAGRRVLKRRRAKGRKNLVPQTNPSSGKRA